MNSELTALTRPRISGGVASCSSDPRMITLIMSAAPLTASAASDSHRLLDSPNTTVAAPKIATQINSRTPARWLIGIPRHHQRHGKRTDRRSRPQRAQPARTRMQNLVRKDRHQRHRAAQQHDKQDPAT